MTTPCRHELVERELEQLRAEGSPLVPVTDRAAQAGDYVELDFRGRAADGSDLPGAVAEGYHVELGARRILPQMEEAVVGHARRASRPRSRSTFPEDYPSPTLAGTTATFDLNLRAVEQRDLAPLDDELARRVSEFDSLAELRADIERVLGERIEREVDGLYRGAVAQALGRVVIIDLPDALIDQRVGELTMGLARAVGERGIPFRRYLELRGQTLEDVQAELRDDAIEGLRRELALEALADRDAIQVSDELLEERLRIDAVAEGIEDVDEILQQVLSSPAKERCARGPALPARARSCRRALDPDRTRAGRGSRADLDTREGGRRGRGEACALDSWRSPLKHHPIPEHKERQ